MLTTLETNVAPKSEDLEDDFPFQRDGFQSSGE